MQHVRRTDGEYDEQHHHTRRKTDSMLDEARLLVRWCKTRSIMILLHALQQKPSELMVGTNKTVLCITTGMGSAEDEYE